MQLDLLEPLSSVTDDSSKTNDPAPVQSIGEHFARIYAEYKKAVDLWATSLSVLFHDEHEILPCESYMQAIKTLDEYDIGQIKAKVAGRIAERLRRHAQKEFAPPGQNLSIDPSDLQEYFPTDREHADLFNPAALWDYLESHYGGNAGEKLAWEQGAKAIIDAFNLRRSDTLESKGGFIILRDSIWCDDFAKKWHKRNTPSYSSQQGIRACCYALATFCAWAEKPELAHDLKCLNNMFSDSHFGIESRKQYVCGTGDLVVVTFNKEFEYRLKQDLATQLNLFIGTYAPNHMRD